jgi:uncharacterized protein (TIGR02145 family)
MYRHFFGHNDFSSILYIHLNHRRQHMNKIRFPSLTASLVLAITFTISCEDKEAKSKPAEATAPPTEAAKAENSDKPSAEAPSAAAPKEGTFTDPRDGKKYKSVKIGKQVWMAENLNFAAKGSKCYENKPDYCVKYGSLYDWNTALKACPNGWHLPSRDEYDALINTVGGDDVAAGKKLKAKSGWEDNFEDDDRKSGNGTDDFGFSALPGGYGLSDGSFYTGDGSGHWWSTNEDSSGSAYSRYMNPDDLVGWGYNDKSRLYSVRCIQD